MKGVSRHIATLFGLGFVPGAPGTVGSVVSFLIFFALLQVPGADRVASSLPVRIGVPAGLILLCWGSIWIGYASDTRGDPDEIILDEVAGVSTFMAILCPSGALFYLVSGLVLFRVFDILKPIPISTVEKVGWGFGVVLDDVVAGVFAGLLIFLLGVYV